jgi:poly-gamma-glutamate synthesis protein (capsule biosynthesis protein)
MFPRSDLPVKEQLGTRAGDAGRPAGRGVTLCLCGDVMTGRGIDQILPHPGNPLLHEPGMPSARCYVDRAERQNGSLAGTVGFDYPWGNLPSAIATFRPALRLANFESVISASDDAWPGKRYHFRMHPDNAPCLRAMAFDCLSLANNHILDWGPSGLSDTLSSLQGMAILAPGAGRDGAEAARPAIIELGSGGRIVVFAFGMTSSHIPVDWAAGDERPGVNLLGDFSDRTLTDLADAIGVIRKAGDLVVLSIHWGDNWGFDIPPEQRNFARRLIDEAGVDIVHGHSSHHVKGLEVHHGKLIIHGSGDLLNDYEAIGDRSHFMHNQSLVYLPVLDSGNGQLVSLTMIPTRIQSLRVSVANDQETTDMQDLLNLECRELGTRVARTDAGYLTLRW